mmetsp:Transcript_108131/g.312460  ORF Transcript_108131/g.312460 Transcript_108131/m.312460 type:complete len:233 (-) Transcript_108131:656-1354(-)
MPALKIAAFLAATGNFIAARNASWGKSVQALLNQSAQRRSTSSNGVGVKRYTSNMRWHDKFHGRSTLGKKVLGRVTTSSFGGVSKPDAAANMPNISLRSGCRSHARLTPSQLAGSPGGGRSSNPTMNLATSWLKTKAKGTRSSSAALLAAPPPPTLRRGRFVARASCTCGGCSCPACSQCQYAQSRKVSSYGPITSGSRRATARARHGEDGEAASARNPSARASSASNLPSP